MSESQYYVLVTIPLVGILMNSGLFLYIAGKVDALVKQVGLIDARVAVLEDRVIREK
jgi:hypothetical protein